MWWKECAYILENCLDQLRGGSLSTRVGAVSKRNLRSSSRDSGLGVSHSRAAQAAGALPPLRSIFPELQAPSTLVGGEATFSGSGFRGTLINCSPPRGAYLLFPMSPLEPLEHMTQPGCMRLHPEGLGLQVSIVGRGVACESVSSLGGW